MPYLQRTVELNPEDVDARFQFALCLANAELYEELIEQLNIVSLNKIQNMQMLIII